MKSKRPSAEKKTIIMLSDLDDAQQKINECNKKHDALVNECNQYLIQIEHIETIKAQLNKENEELKSKIKDLEAAKENDDMHR